LTVNYLDSGTEKTLRNFRWWSVPLVVVGAVVWLELFLRWQLESVVLLLAILGWWDYQRRRAKLKPPSY
jgi:hypothetical protein